LINESTNKSINKLIKTSIRSNKNIFISTKFQDKKFDKEFKQIHMTKMIKNNNSDDEDEFAII
jgi:hypothetical protein